MIKGIYEYKSNVQGKKFSRGYLLSIGCIGFSSGIVGIDDVGDMDFGMVSYPVCRWVEYGPVMDIGIGSVISFDDYLFRDVEMFGLHKLRRYYQSFGEDGNEQPGSGKWIIEFLN